MSERGRPDFLTRNVANQGLVAALADLEKRAAALEKQWRQATGGSGSGSASSSSSSSLTNMGEIMTAIRGERGLTGATGPAGPTGATGATGAAGSNGTPDASIWMPDAPPLSAGSEDDEFADASGGVPGGWTEVDHGSVMTVTEIEAGVRLFQATHAGDSVSGIYKAIPAGNFTIWTKIGLAGISITNYVTGGLALWQDATSSTGDLVNFVFQFDASSVNTGVNWWNAYNSFNSTLASRAINDPDLGGNSAYPTHAYLRIRRTGTTYAFDIGSDGVGWTRIHSGTLAFTPTHFGPCINNVNTGQDVAAQFPFFRYVSSDAGITGLMSGDRIGIVRF